MDRVIVAVASSLLLCACGAHTNEMDSNDLPSAGSAREPVTEAGEWVSVAVVDVNDGPLFGQRRRASRDFAIDPPSHVRALKWNIVTKGATDVTFSVALDIHRGSDETVLEDLRTGVITAVHTGQNLYIRDVRDAPFPFKIEVLGQVE